MYQVHSDSSDAIYKYNVNAGRTTLTDSLLLPQQVFNGNYWDDFTLPLFLRRNIQHVLCLGLGYGAGVRPLFAFNPDLSITGVDIDHTSNEVCRNLFSNIFRMPLDIVTSDANLYLDQASDSYDLIWVDLYDSNGYVADLHQLPFWEKLRHRLSSRSLVALNIYGIATHLEPYLAHTPLKYFQSLLGSLFPYQLVLSHRRNVTLVLSNAEFEQVDYRENATLNSFDKLTLSSQHKRAQRISRTNGAKARMAETAPISTFSFDTLNQLQKQGWSHFLHDMNGSLDFSFISAQAMASYLQDAQTGPLLIQQLTDFPHLLKMIPTFLGAEIHNSKSSFNWYFEYLSESTDLIEKAPDVWAQSILPQWIAMLNSRPDYRNTENENLIAQMENEYERRHHSYR